ncbi:MAG: PD-(D/E)XK nuclease domain-containing protein, partial [Oligoflexales bacterium]|nr:PD-(D/E)XK nuclease domain-containing protein [Oligoflexales bacterium]
GVLTGILRVAKESIFSDLNNLDVSTVLSNDDAADKFGFTEAEVKHILDDYALSEKYEEVRFWYNGYRFGEQIIYNPWSIMKLINKPQDGFTSHWANTSSNDLLDRLIANGDSSIQQDIEILISGSTLNRGISENIVLKDVWTDSTSLWSFFLFAGYLTVDSVKKEGIKFESVIRIPNAEVNAVYRSSIERWFGEKAGGPVGAGKIVSALLSGDIPLFTDLFSDLCAHSLSVHDIARSPEAFYHGFVLGLMVIASETHDILSNRESGYGRYDVTVVPRDKTKPGIIIEFKVVNKRLKETGYKALSSALKQIEEKKYDLELKARGIVNIIKLAIVFDGKRVIVSDKPVSQLDEGSVVNSSSESRQANQTGSDLKPKGGLLNLLRHLFFHPSRH